MKDDKCTDASLCDKDIVISGISGRFPESDNVEEFSNNLMEGRDMVTEDDRRWPPGTLGLPSRFGKINNLTKFDAAFFGIHGKQAEKIDPSLGKLLELTYEAIVDSGTNPEDMRGTNTGVYVGLSAGDAIEYFSKESDPSGYGLLGCNRAMFANRVSYTFNLRGPSLAIDTACSSSLTALSLAIDSIKNGECNAAIVAGCNLVINPKYSKMFKNVNMLSNDGYSRCFDDSCNGYVRSESCVVVFIQKMEVAKRIYASVLNIGLNSDGYKDNGITFPSGQMQKKLMLDVLEKGKINSKDITYVEAHCTGTIAGDPEEINSIADVYCKGRTTPLLIGTVKSNMGHSEAASGLCALTKVVIAMESGILPANLYFQTPNSKIPSLCNGMLKVVVQNTKWNGGIVALNNFGFGGTNVHLLVKSNTKTKIQTSNDDPVLITVSGRTKHAVEYFLNKIEKLPRDNDLISLINEIHKKNIPGHLNRGYCVMGKKTELKEVSTQNKKPQIWYVFAGMASQRSEMGRAFMRIEPFAEAILKCAAVLKKHDVDLLDLIFEGSDEQFEDVLNAIVSITSIQVALVDTLHAFGVDPDGMFGHSAGEIACAYADGCITAEQAVLIAYWRGKCILNTDLKPASMAALGMSLEETNDCKPPTCEVACHNGKDSVTLSGPTEDVENFVTDLQSHGVFAKVINSCGYGFHSKYVEKVRPKLTECLQKIIPYSKSRSKKWISTSVPESEWSSDQAGEFLSAYFVNNFHCRVLFYQALLHIPEDAVIIELSPHSILRSIMQRSVSRSCTYIGLLKKGMSNEMSFFLGNLGKLYNSGFNLNLDKLQKPVCYPVGRGTPMISPMILMDHNISWKETDFRNMDTLSSQCGESIISVDMSNSSSEYLTGHNIDGRIVFPASGYLVLVWEMYARLNKKSFTEFPVEFENVNFLRATIMPKTGAIRFHINIFSGCGDFEICESSVVVVRGTIKVSEGLDINEIFHKPQVSELTQVARKDVYKDLKLKGYNYSGQFQGIIKSDVEGLAGEIEWLNNWTTFIDCMLQFSLLSRKSRDLALPTRILRIIIDPFKQATAPKDRQGIEVVVNNNVGIIKAGGLEVHGVKTTVISKKKKYLHPKLEKYVFIPYNCIEELSKEDALTVMLQIVMENSNTSQLRITEILDNKEPEWLLSSSVTQIIDMEPIIKAEVKQFSIADLRKTGSNKEENLHLIVINANSLTKETVQNMIGTLDKNGFVLINTVKGVPLSILRDLNELTLISTISTKQSDFILLRKVDHWIKPKIIRISQENFNWLDAVKDAMRDAYQNKQKYIIVSEKEQYSGILGLFNSIKKESGGENFRCVLIDQKSSVSFSLDTFKDQLSKDLTINVFKNGVWGSYKHLLLQNEEQFSNFESEYITTVKYGELSSLKWTVGPLTYYKPKDADICKVYYASLNFRDVVMALGEVPLDAVPKYSDVDNSLGIEYAGCNSKGNRIMGMVPANGLATSVLFDDTYTLPIPDKWSMEEAATVPVVYTTCYYALIVRGQMKKGESILIHSGAGGVGLAAITLSLAMGCEVFTTVGAEEKKLFLKRHFPDLKEDHIGYSRDTSFERMIKEKTKGRGVDLVLNSLIGDKLQASVRCLADHGRFLEIGKVDLIKNASLGMAILLKNISVHGIFVDLLFERKFKNAYGKQVMQLLRDGITSGVVKPLPTTVFNAQQIEQSFRYMSLGRHIGKILLRIRDEDKLCLNEQSTGISGISQIYFSPQKTYIIIGGLGGVGLELANWMFTRGAKILILTSRSGVTNGYQRLCLRRWKENGYNVLVSNNDASTLDDATKLLIESNELAPVGGIFNLAFFLRDALLVNQTEDNFKMVCKSKINTTYFLDKASRLKCKHLEYFVVFSSLACGRGMEGQSNYGMANSAMERICEARKLDGFPGLAIQWGPIGDAGYVAESMLIDKKTSLAGTFPQAIESCIYVMDSLMNQKNTIVSSIVISKSDTKKLGSQNSFVQEIGNIMGIKDVSTVNFETSLSDFGLDSLISTEIKQSLERNYDIILNSTEIRSLTFTKLTELEKSIRNDCKDIQESGVESKLVTICKLLPKETILQLKTSRENKKVLFVLPPVEGNISFANEMVAHINSNICGLQCSEEVPIQSVEDLASFYVQVVRKHQPNGPYFILGYSFGANVAFEMVKQLEKQNKISELVMVDGSPDFVKKYIQLLGGNSSTKSKQSASILAHFGTILLEKPKGMLFDQLFEELSLEKDLDSQLLKCADKLKMETPISKNDILDAAKYFYHKIMASLNYSPSGTIKSRITLITATESPIIIEEDYGLRKHCEQEISLHKLKTTHMDIVKGESGRKIADIVTSLINN